MFAIGNTVIFTLIKLQSTYKEWFLFLDFDWSIHHASHAEWCKTPVQIAAVHITVLLSQ